MYFVDLKHFRWVLWECGLPDSLTQSVQSLYCPVSEQVDGKSGLLSVRVESMPGATCHRFCSKPSWTEFLGAALDWRWSSLAAAESGLNRAVCSQMRSSWDEFDTSKSKVAVPNGRKGLEYPLWFEDEILPQVEKFKGQKNSGFNSPSTF